MSTSGTVAQYKYEQVRDLLLERIRSGDLSVNDKLPSIQATSRELGVSYVTAQRAYRNLAEAGVLDVRRGAAGTYVASPQPSWRRRPVTVGGVFRRFMERNRVDNYALEIYEALCQTLAVRHAGLIHHRARSPETIETLRGQIETGRVDGVLLDEDVPDEDIRTLLASGALAVLYNRVAPDLDVDAVCPDMEWMGHETARRVLAGPYRRVVLCDALRREHYADKYRAQRLYLPETYFEAVRRTCRDEGLGGPEVVTRLQMTTEEAAHWEDDDCYARHLLIPDKPDGVVTAYVALADRPALRVRAILEKRGFRVPEDAGVIGIYDQVVNHESRHPVATWALDPARLGRLAAETLLERIEFPERDRRRLYMRGDFVDNGTL